MTIGIWPSCSILCTGGVAARHEFRGSSIEQMCDALEAAGCQRHGRRRLRSGFTGEVFDGEVFFAPAFYQRLKHMAADKIHARARGPMHVLSRQPTEGRARDGGLRFGEMERDCLISYGVTETLLDRLMYNSDISSLTVCGTCGLLAQPSAHGTYERNRKALCKNCNSECNVHDLNAPFSFRLLLQELQAMSIAVRFEM